MCPHPPPPPPPPIPWSWRRGPRPRAAAAPRTRRARPQLQSEATSTRADIPNTHKSLSTKPPHKAARVESLAPTTVECVTDGERLMERARKAPQECGGTLHCRDSFHLHTVITVAPWMWSCTRAVEGLSGPRWSEGILSSPQLTQSSRQRAPPLPYVPQRSTSQTQPQTYIRRLRARGSVIEMKSVECSGSELCRDGVNIRGPTGLPIRAHFGCCWISKPGAGCTVPMSCATQAAQCTSPLLPTPVTNTEKVLACRSNQRRGKTGAEQHYLQ